MSECLYHVWQFTHKHHNTLFLYILFPKNASTPRNALNHAALHSPPSLCLYWQYWQIIDFSKATPTCKVTQHWRVSGSPTWGQTVAFTLASRRLTLHGKRTWRAGARGQTGVTVGSHTHGPHCAYPRRKMMKKKEEEKRASWCKCPQAEHFHRVSRQHSAPLFINM